MNESIQSICENYELEVLFYNTTNGIEEFSTLFDIANKKLVYGKSSFLDTYCTIESVSTPQGNFRIIKSPSEKLLKYKSSSFPSSYITLELNNVCLNNPSLLQKGKNLFIKYQTIARVIPYVQLEKHLSTALSIIHQYIATGKLNINKLQNLINKLQNTYYEFAPRSLALLLNFIQNPKSCDIANLCDNITKSINNIHKIIEFKSADLYPKMENRSEK